MAKKTCTTIFFLIPKNVTSERPIALRASEVAKWQQKYRVDWDALPTGEMEEISAQCEN